MYVCMYVAVYLVSQYIQSLKIFPASHSYTYVHIRSIHFSKYIAKLIIQQLAIS